MKSIILKKKKIDLSTRRYKLSKTQFKSLVNKNIEEPLNYLSVHENLVFYSFDYGYCLVRHKANKSIDNENYWLIECFLERDNKNLEMFLTEKRINELISYNTQIQSEGRNLKGYLTSHFNAILD